MTVTQSLNNISLGMETKEPTIAHLPAFPFFIASQFVDKTKMKALLTVIHVRVEDGYISIEATNGHIAFRFKFPKTEKFYANESFLVSSESFQKRVVKGNSIIFNENNYASIQDKFDQWIESRAWKNPLIVEANTYPNLPEIIPTEFSNEFKNSFSFNAKYMKLISQMVATYSSTNVMTFNGNHSTTPFMVTAKTELNEFEHLEKDDQPKLEFLVMPIQVRS